MDSFCNYCGLNIDREKSNLIVSKICKASTKNLLTSFFDIKISNNFGIYLEFPILNNNPKHKDCQFLIDKMWARLNNCYARWLSMTGRSTLVSSTLNTILNHLSKYPFYLKKDWKKSTKYKETSYGVLLQRRKNFT